MPEPLTAAELAAIRERWEREERRLFTAQSRLIESGELGPHGRITRPVGHDDIPRLLSTIDALVAAGDALCAGLCDEGWDETSSVLAWRALRRGEGGDG